MSIIRLVIGTTVAAGALLAPAAAEAACVEPHPVAKVCADLGVHTGIGSGTLGVTSAQAVCVPASGPCSGVPRTAAYYNYGAGGLCVRVAGAEFESTANSCL